MHDQAKANQGIKSNIGGAVPHNSYNMGPGASQGMIPTPSAGGMPMGGNPMYGGGIPSNGMPVPSAAAGSFIGAGYPMGGAYPSTPTPAPMQQESYIENILRLNLGKIATIYMTFENNKDWNAKIFKGRLEAAGRDHIIISDPQTGKRNLLLMVYLDYISFDEELSYEYPYAGF